MATENDSAWKRFFDAENVLPKLQNNGFCYIDAKKLKKLGNREPRLMAKIDTLDLRPQVFQKNQISIFPTKNGEYILFKDQEEKSFFKFSTEDFELPIKIYTSKTDLLKFDSYPGGQKFSESQSLDFAFISSLIKTFTHEEDLSLVIRGRMFSSSFDFKLPQTNHQVNVKGVQIELDAGYESNNSIYLFEAKIGKRDNFNIRQLFYPYLEWSHRSKKKVVPIFLIYTNSKYYFYEFQFSDIFGDLEILRKDCYSVNESPITEINLPLLLNTIRVDMEPKFPYPQANDLDKVIDTLTLVNNGVTNKFALGESLEIDERQGDYYANAACYLGYLKRENGEYLLTTLGDELLNMKYSKDRTLSIVKQLIQKPTFNKAIKLLISKDLKIHMLTTDEVSTIIEKDTILTGSTPLRRASTVISWLNWILEHKG